MGSFFLVLTALGLGWLLYRSADSSKSTSKISLDPYVGIGDDVWLLGDSLAVGISKRLIQNAATDGIRLSVTARVGAQTLWGSIQAKGPAARDHSVWLVCLGANDAALPVPSSQFSKWVQSILQSAEGAGAQVVWLVAPNGGGLPGYDKVFEIVTNTASDLILPPKDLKFAKGGVHLTPDSYEKWADYVWQSVVSSRQVVFEQEAGDQ